MFAAVQPPPLGTRAGGAGLAPTLRGSVVCPGALDLVPWGEQGRVTALAVATHAPGQKAGAAPGEGVLAAAARPAHREQGAGEAV